MLERESIMREANTMMEEMAGVRRTTGISSIEETKTTQSIETIPESKRSIFRRFSAEYKFLILKEAESCKEQGQPGTRLRRGRLY